MDDLPHTIECLYCGKIIRVEDARDHMHSCPKYRKNDSKKINIDIPPIPDAIENCTCENCVGIKHCARCNEESMYLHRKKRIWICANRKCNCFSFVDAKIKHIISENNVNIQRRLEFFQKYLKDKDL